MTLSIYDNTKRELLIETLNNIQNLDKFICKTQLAIKCKIYLTK